MKNSTERKVAVFVINMIVLLSSLFGLMIYTAHEADGGQFLIHIFLVSVFILLGIVHRTVVISRWSSKLNAVIPFLFALSFPLPVIIDGSLSETMKVVGFTLNSIIFLCLVITLIIELKKPYEDIKKVAAFQETH